MLLADPSIDPILVLLAALVLDAALGEMSFVFRHVPHPIAALGRLTTGQPSSVSHERRKAVISEAT